MTGQTNSDAQWDAFSEILPERDDINVPDEIKDDGNKMVNSSRAFGVPKLSDAQSVLKQLFPDLGKPYLNNLMIGRVFPDLYNDLFDIIVKGLLQDNPQMTVDEAIVIAEVALSVPIDGEGRIDTLALINGQQSLELEKGKKDLI